MWSGGEELLREWPVAIVPRAGISDSLNLALHPSSIVIQTKLPDCSSSEVRRRILAGEPFEHLLVPQVAAQIKQNGLYGYKI
jgi:nicotinic acid mononucleotide adenylyltransferase